MLGHRSLATLALTLPLASSACGAPDPVRSTGGTSAEHGLVVVCSDRASTNVALLGFDGSVLSPSFINSGSTDSRLSASLSGDVVLPTSPVSGGEVVLVDRLARSVLTWVRTSTGRVRAQLPVGTGFKSNPHDFVPIANDKAYATRYEPNARAGSEAYDAGDDLLVVDPSLPAITGRIDLKGAMQDAGAQYFARPDRALIANGRAYVLLNGYDRAFSDATDARIAVIDTQTDELRSVTVLSGIRNCWGMTATPDGSKLALACSGLDLLTSADSPPDGALVVLTPDGDELSVSSFPASEFGLGPLDVGIAFATPSRVVFTTLGRDDGGAGRADALIELDLTTRAQRVLLRSQGSPLSLGDVRCVADTQACFVTDVGREAGVVHQFSIAGDGHLEYVRAVRIGDGIGLPPRSLGEF